MMTTYSLPGDDLSQRVSRSFTQLPLSQRGNVSATELADRLTRFLDARLNGKGFSPEDEIPPHCSLVLDKLGLTKAVIEQAISVSVAPAPRDLSRYVYETTKESIGRIRNVLTEVLPSQKDPEKRAESKLSINAWLCSAFAYAAQKVALTEPDSELRRTAEQKAGRIVDEAAQWLLSESVFRDDGCYKGWNRNPRENNSPMLNDTAFVANILVRLRGELATTAYEDCIDSVLRMPKHDNTLWWLDPNTNEPDLAGTSYALRLFCNYIKYRPNEYDKEGWKSRLKEKRESLCYLLGDELLSLPYKEFEEKPLEKGELSYAAKVALMADAIRGAEKPRRWAPVKVACEWLLNRIEFYEGNWCWTIQTKTKENEVRKVQGVHDSALIVSALLRGSVYSRFSEADTVICWLVDQIKSGGATDNEYYGPVVCALSDYLGAWKIREFFES